VIATGLTALFALALSTPDGESNAGPFPELERDPRTRRGLVVLAGAGCDRSQLGLGTEEPRARLVLADAGRRPRIVTGPEIVVELVPGSRELVDDRERLDALSDVQTIRFGDGSAVDWVRALYPLNRRTLLAARLWRRHEAGATVLAFGRAAAALGAVVPVEPDELGAIGRRPRNPRDAADESSFWTLGFLPWALVDVGGTPRGSVERWIERAWRDRFRLAVWIPRHGALIADVASGRATARGAEPVLWLDLKPARRSRDWLLGGRLSTLRAGGRWEHEERRVRPTGSTAEADVPRGGEALEWTSPDVLDDALWERILESFERPDAPRSVRVIGNFFELSVSIDTETALYVTEDGFRLLDRLRFDLSQKKTSEKRR